MRSYKVDDLVWVQVYDEKCEIILVKAVVLEKQELHSYLLMTNEGYPSGSFIGHEDSIYGLVIQMKKVIEIN